MDAKEYIDYLRNRFHTYSMLKMMLRDVKDKDEFNNLVNDLFDEIFNDQRDFNEWTRNNQPLVIPVEKKYMELESYARSILDFFVKYKELKIL